MTSSGSHDAARQGRWPGWLFASLQGYRKSSLPGDALAALTLAAIAIPEQLATARLVGMPPATGLIAFMAGAIAFAAFGSNRILSVGADSTIAPIIAGSVVVIAATGTPHYIELVITLSLMVGVVLLLTKPLRLGWVADMLSIPVTTGFLAGIAVHIIAVQVPVIIDVVPTSEQLILRIIEMIRRFPETNPITLMTGLVVFVCSQFSDRLSRLLPGPLIGIVISALVVWALPLDPRAVPVMQTLSVSLPFPEFSLPNLSDFTLLVPAALVIALVCMMQTSVVEQYVPESTGNPGDVARDFAAIGVGSLLAGWFGAFAVNASPPRTAIVLDAGGRSQLSSLLAAALVVMLTMLFAKAFALVPQAALAGVLVSIGVRIVRLGVMRRIFRANKHEFVLVLASAALVVALPVGVGVGMSIVLSLMHSIYIIARPQCEELLRVPETTIWWSRSADGIGEREPDILVFAPGAPLNFTNAKFIADQLQQKLQAMDSPCRTVVLEGHGVIDIDYTAAQIFKQAIRDLHARSIDVAIARLESGRALEAATRTRLLETLGPERVFKSVAEAVAAMKSDPDGMAISLSNTPNDHGK